LPFVQLAGQQGQLLAAPGRTSSRHHSVLVVVEGAADGAQQTCLMQVLVKLCKG
jgi:hypothetical protein